MASSPPCVWTLEDDKALENALAALPPSDDGEAWMREVAGRVPGRSLGEVRRYYEFLMEDLRAIEAGRIALPNYTDGNDDKGDQSQCHDQRRQQNSPTGSGDRKGLFESGRGLSKSEQERRKGIPWTEEEHKLFLIGLSKFGKGDWRSISRNFVISRTPTQVASHAQKYFIRLNSMNRDRRRSSIHDITSINGGGEMTSPNQGAITGQNGVAPSAMKQPPPQPPSNLAAMGMYGPVGQPVTGHVVPAAVGTPVMLPHGHPPYVVPMAYPVQPPPMMHRQR